MGTPLIEPAGAPAPKRRDPESDTGPRSVDCDFCGCRVNRKGEVLEMSSRAVKLRTADEALDLAKSKISELAGQLDTLRAELAQLKTTPAPKRRGGVFDSDDDED